jgi:hydrogenase maturation protein HypF
MPGGDAAIKYPGRMALGALYTKLGSDVWGLDVEMADEEREGVIQMLKTETNCYRTSSMGRLFDAMSVLLRVCGKRTYEGQPAIELEGIADSNEKGIYPVQVNSLIIDGAAVLVQALEDFRKGTGVSIVSARFHNTIAHLTVELCRQASPSAASRNVCLSGGCFMNALLTERVVAGLTEAGFEPVLHRLVPPNDECIAYGQLVVAGAKRV